MIIFLKNTLIKINGGRNISKKESFGKTSFQYPTKVAKDDASAGAKEG